MFSIYPLSFPLQPGFHLLYLYLHLLTVCLVCFFVLPLLFYISCTLPPWCSIPGTSVVMLHLWLSPQLFSSPYTLPSLYVIFSALSCRSFCQFLKAVFLSLTAVCTSSFHHQVSLSFLL